MEIPAEMRLRVLAMTCRAFLFAFLFALAPLAIHASAERMRAPWDGLKIVPADVPYNCPQPPAFSRTLNVQG